MHVRWEGNIEMRNHLYSCGPQPHGFSIGGGCGDRVGGKSPAKYPGLLSIKGEDGVPHLMSSHLLNFPIILNHTTSAKESGFPSYGPGP